MHTLNGGRRFLPASSKCLIPYPETIYRYSNGGGGNRTCASSDVNLNPDNNLAPHLEWLAALWLHRADIDPHDMARIGRIVEAWTFLP
ncbi:MAG: hypothetical protein AB8G99_17875, partial [Planctomycetaceae bacterium]